jgi:potassium-transporting ATPase potassium-binding subunit
VTLSAWLQLLFLVALLAVSTPLLGAYMARIYSDGAAPGDRFFLPVERLIYRVCRVDPDREQRWNVYAYSVLAFSLVSGLILYVQLRLQGHLPLNPDHMKAVPPGLSFNTAMSFLTNTNWQNYSGESTMAHLTQMAGLALHNFVSAAVGAAVAVALIRGLIRRKSGTLGNFWVDMTRTTTRLFLPLAFVGGVFLLSQGAVQNFHAARVVTTVEGKQQSIPGGPIASQESIKNLGENGGGPYNANASHPFENPNSITNIFIIWGLLAVPFAFPFAFGKMAKDQKQGWVVFAAMFALWVAAALIAMPLEARGNKHLTAVGADQHVTALQSGGNMEGKEVRFGAVGCGLFAPSTTGTSTGSVDCMHDSMTAIGGAVPLVNMMLGEVSPGGTGAGLYGMLIFALTSVFIAGLMVGRTPEYLGKKIQAAEMKLVVLYLLAVPLAILSSAGVAALLNTGLASLTNSGPHGLSEMVYAFTSASNNNGSAFAGLNGNTQFFNATLGLCFLIGRFMLMIPALAIAGSLGRKQPVPPSAGTFPTGTPLFGVLLTGVVLIVVGLTYFPVLALGPITEHLVGKF